MQDILGLLLGFNSKNMIIYSINVCLKITRRKFINRITTKHFIEELFRQISMNVAFSKPDSILYSFISMFQMMLSPRSTDATDSPIMPVISVTMLSCSMANGTIRDRKDKLFSLVDSIKYTKNTSNHIRKSVVIDMNWLTNDTISYWFNSYI